MGMDQGTVRGPALNLTRLDDVLFVKAHRGTVFALRKGDSMQTTFRTGPDDLHPLLVDIHVREDNEQPPRFTMDVLLDWLEANGVERNKNKVLELMRIMNGVDQA
jgi:hypothetical protein